MNIETTHNRVQAKFRLFHDDVYFIELVDSVENKSANPIRYHLQVMQDQFPFVAIRRPGKDVDLTDDMILPIGIEAGDDYGISSIKLFSQIIWKNIFATIYL